MKTILAMRHAKSSWDSPAGTDHDRPLNERGFADAPRMGAWLKEQGVVPELIISSTARRARQTAVGVIEGSGYGEEWEQTADFYHADPEAYIERLAQLPDALERVMVVGHNPGIEELVNLLTDEFVMVTTANIAHITVPIAHWADLTAVGEGDLIGQLVHFWQPCDIP